MTEKYRLDRHKNRKNEVWYTVLTPNGEWITDANNDIQKFNNRQLAENAAREHWESQELPVEIEWLDLTESPQDRARRMKRGPNP